jgi:hypothetical protein
MEVNIYTALSIGTPFMRFRSHEPISPWTGRLQHQDSIGRASAAVRELDHDGSTQSGKTRPSASDKGRVLGQGISQRKLEVMDRGLRSSIHGV